MAKQSIEKVNKDDVLVDVAAVTKDAQHWLEVYKKPILYGIIGLVVAVGGW